MGDLSFGRGSVGPQLEFPAPSAASFDGFILRGCFPAAPSYCPFFFSLHLAVNWLENGHKSGSFASGDVMVSSPAGGGALPAQLPPCARAEPLKVNSAVLGCAAPSGGAPSRICGSWMWIHGSSERCQQPVPFGSAAEAARQEIFRVLSSTQRHKKLLELGMGRSICFGRIIQEGRGRNPPAAREDLPSPGSDLALPGSDGEGGRPGPGMMSETLGMLPFGNLSHRDKMCRMRLLNSAS